jgi:hypothetical protein
LPILSDAAEEAGDVVENDDANLRVYPRILTTSWRITSRGQHEILTATTLYTSWLVGKINGAIRVLHQGLCPLPKLIQLHFPIDVEDAHGRGTVPIPERFPGGKGYREGELKERLADPTRAKHHYGTAFKQPGQIAGPFSNFERKQVGIVNQRFGQIDWTRCYLSQQRPYFV